MKQLDEFACSCGGEAPRMAALHRWVTLTFLSRRPAIRDRATMLLHLLESRYEANVEQVVLDQWGAMTIQTTEHPSVPDPGVSIYMQFDRFEDGLALALKRLHAEYGPDRPDTSRDPDRVPAEGDAA